MPAAKAGRRGDAQVAAGLDAAGRDAGLGIGQVGQQALAVLQKGAAFVRQGDAPGGAHQQLDAQPLFQRVEPAPHDGRRYAFSQAGCRQATSRGH